MKKRHTDAKETGNKGPSLELRCDRFIERLKQQGYRSWTVRYYEGALRCLIEKMQQKGISASRLDDHAFEQIAKDVRAERPNDRRQYDLYCLGQFRKYLIAGGDAPVPKPIIDPSPRAVLRRAYERYLREQRGLSESTIATALWFYEGFMRFRFGKRSGPLKAITAKDVVAFILKYRQSAGRDKTVPTHLRTFCAFLFWSGRSSRELMHAIPRTRPQQRTSMPRYLSPEQVQRLIESVRADHKKGRRNYAMLLLVARLGLRAPEVITIELGDIDWRAGEILIRGKGKRLDPSSKAFNYAATRRRLLSTFSDSAVGAA